MFEIIGIVFGGLTRLAQHWMEMKDGQGERDHEYRMFEKQLELAHKQVDTAYDLAQMETDSALLAKAIESQTELAKAAGGFMLALSASVRPVVSYWLLGIYSLVKFCILYLAIVGTGVIITEPITAKQGITIAKAILSVYTEFDGALLGSIMSYWFADRSLRKAGK
jgi:hypothetical protein